MTRASAELWQSIALSAPRIIAVTGGIGAGKTTWCDQLIAHVRGQGLLACGLLSPAVFTAGEKTAIDLLSVASGERRRLALRRAAPDTKSPTPNWQFDPDVLAWGNDLLGALDWCDLLVIDELGPLELRRHQGWQNAFPVLASRSYRLACVVVRQHLVAAFLERFPTAERIHIG